ncbi:SIS domain-containing protein [Patescibacteria group bacterium]|nr:SIS domain-containing protein [Patescibacteria group bacterium]
MRNIYEERSAELRSALSNLDDWYTQIEQATEIIKRSFEHGGTVYVAGNGGSATLAQHLSDELVGRYKADRKPFPVVALTTDGAVLTVIGNDYGYEQIFSRQLEALGKEGDVFIGFTTSGSSENILRATTVAQEKGMKVIAFTGNFGPFKELADLAVISPAKSTGSIQELDLHAVHLICEAFEPAKEEQALKMSMDRIEELVGTFASKKVLIIGDVMIDHYMEGTVDRINPEAPVPILKVKRHRDMTGGAGNTAKNVAALGAVTHLVSVVGKDDNRKIVEGAAKAEGYTTWLIEDGSRPTIRKERYLVNNQQLLRIDREETHDIDEEIAGQVVDQMQQIVADGIDGIIVSDYAKGVITEKVARSIMKLAKKYKIPVAADVKPSRIEFFADVTFVSPNVKEAHEYLGLNSLEQGGKSPEQLGQMIYERWQLPSFITLGAQGVYAYISPQKHYHVPQSHAVEVADVSGAGDTAIAAQMLAKLSGATAQEIALISNAAGAVVVQKSGSVGISPEELKLTLMYKK